MDISTLIHKYVRLLSAGTANIVPLSFFINRMILLIILFTLLAQSSVGDIVNSTLCIPQNGEILFGVHPPIQYHRTEMDVTSASIESFTHAVGKSPAIVTFSHEWGVNRSFPHQQFSDIHQSGATPWVRMMLRTDNKQNKPEPLFTLNRIINGIYDTDLKNWASHARNLGYPIIIEYGTEVNGQWFSWNGYWTGNTQGPEKFKEAYRHIIKIMTDEGAYNLIWVYHVNWHSHPEESWNSLAAYYPGDEYIDIFGISAYGALHPDTSEFHTFSNMMNKSYQELITINPKKPIVIAETGTDIKNRNVNAIEWTKEALRDLGSGTWPRVIGVVWWNSAWPNDGNTAHNTSMRIEEDSRMSLVFKEYVGNNTRFLNQTEKSC